MMVMLALSPAPAEVKITTSEYLPDTEFPQLLPWIIDGYDLKYGMGEGKAYGELVPSGATLRLFFQNTLPHEATVDGVLVNEINLAEHLLPRHREHMGIQATSYHLNDSSVTPPDVVARLDKLGEPVWFQVRPNPLPAGAYGEATVRFRHVTDENGLSLRLKTGDGLTPPVKISTIPATFTIASISFSYKIDRLFLYIRDRTGADFILKEISLDGKRMDAETTGTLASCAGFLPVEIPLSPPWEYGSFHHVAVTDRSGRSAATIIRARDAFFALGMWGYRNRGTTVPEQARDTCAAFRDHLFNTHMSMAGSHTGFLEWAEGLKLMGEMGLRFLARDPNKADCRSPVLYARFLLDEPDAHEYAVNNLPNDRRLGTYAQGLAERQGRWVATDPRTLTLLNVDETYKPQNWFMYGQLADILSIDPYYQGHLKDVYWRHPGWLGRYYTPYCVYASAEVARAGCEPHPLHIILNAVSHEIENRVFRYGTPEEKRIEFYCALAAGAKGISYWWFTPYGEFKGCGSDDPAAIAMMNEMRMLNAEARAVEPLFATSHPAAWGKKMTDPFTSAKPSWLMVRTLFCGDHTAVLVFINRDHASDRAGTYFEPVKKATVTFRTPPWMKPVDAFSVGYSSVHPIVLKPEKGAFIFQMDDVKLTEMVIITDDISLRGRVADSARALATAGSGLLSK
jgi:hypothetical protein